MRVFAIGDRVKIMTAHVPNTVIRIERGALGTVRGVSSNRSERPTAVVKLDKPISDLDAFWFYQATLEYIGGRLPDPDFDLEEITQAKDIITELS